MRWRRINTSIAGGQIMARGFCTALLCFGFTVVANAADSGAAYAPAAATAEAETGALAEVVVTARRRAEDLQSVPLTVNAITASAIQAQDVTSLEDLNSFVPNLKVTNGRATSSTINVYIR